MTKERLIEKISITLGIRLDEDARSSFPNSCDLFMISPTGYNLGLIHIYCSDPEKSWFVGGYGALPKVTTDKLTSLSFE